MAQPGREVVLAVESPLKQLCKKHLTLLVTGDV